MHQSAKYFGFKGALPRIKGAVLPQTNFPDFRITGDTLHLRVGCGVTAEQVRDGTAPPIVAFAKGKKRRASPDAPPKRPRATRTAGEEVVNSLKISFNPFCVLLPRADVAATGVTPLPSPPPVVHHMPTSLLQPRRSEVARLSIPVRA
jgi:hypothetical protein